MTLKQNQLGFTLIELLVVIAIIGLLASLILPSLTAGRLKARDAARIANLRSIQTSLELYFDTNRAYPTALSVLVTAGYLPAVPQDPLAASGCSDFSNCNYEYAYYPASTPLDYHIGASLENITNAALQNARHCNSITGSNCPVNSPYTNGFNGSTSAGCDGTAGRACYDLTN